MGLTKRFVAILVTASLLGCLPVEGTYLRLDQSDATYIKSSCYGAVGAPNITFFPFHGIYLSAAINQGYGEVVVGIHIPEGQTAQLLGRELEITYSTDHGFVSARFHLQPVHHNRHSGNSPYVFQYPDPFKKEDYFGLLTGGTREIRFALFGTPKTAYKWYEFSIPFERNWRAPGSIQFPAMKVNGIEKSGPRLPFTKENYFEFSAINC